VQFLHTFEHILFTELSAARKSGIKDTLTTLQSILNQSEPKTLDAAFSTLKLPLVLGNREAAAFFKYQTFTIARIINQEILDGLQKSLAVALENGIGFPAWKKSAVALLEKQDSILPNHRLRTIYKTNTSLAYAAGQIAALEHAKDDFPLWEFKAVMDTKTRQEHRVLNGKIFETGDWTYFPPVGFNCRCRARIIPKSKATSLKPSTVNDLEQRQLKNTDFINNKNTAFARWVAEKKKSLPKPVKDAIDNRERKLISELGFAPKDFIQKQYLNFSTNPNYIEIISSKDTFVFQHKNADKIGLKENLNAAIRLSKFGISVEIREHSFADFQKNPEFTLITQEGDTLLADLKTPNPKQYSSIISSIKGQFKEAVTRQNLSHFVLDIIKLDEPLLDISRGLHSGFRLYPQIESVFVLRGRKMVKITRESFERGNIEDELRVIF